MAFGLGICHRIPCLNQLLPSMDERLERLLKLDTVKFHRQARVSIEYFTKEILEVITLYQNRMYFQVPAPVVALHMSNNQGILVGFGILSRGDEVSGDVLHPGAASILIRFALVKVVGFADSAGRCVVDLLAFGSYSTSLLDLGDNLYIRLLSYHLAQASW